MVTRNSSASSERRKRKSRRNAGRPKPSGSSRTKRRRGRGQRTRRLPEVQASDVAARSFDVAIAIVGALSIALDIALVRRALPLLGKARFRISALLEVFAGILTLAADEAAAALAAFLRTDGLRLAALLSGRGAPLPLSGPPA